MARGKKQMTTMLDDTVVDPWQIIADLQRKLGASTAELSEALEQHPRFLRRLDRERQHAHGLLPGRLFVLRLARTAWHRRARRYRAFPCRCLSQGPEGIGAWRS